MSERLNKVNSIIQRALSDIILMEHNHPSFTMITIHQVTTSKDLNYCDVYVTSLTNQEDLIKYLNKIKPILQRKMGKKIILKKIPKLRFKIDDSIEHMNDLNELINTLNT